MAAGTRNLTLPAATSANGLHVSTDFVQTVRRVISIADVAAVKGSAVEVDEVIQAIAVKAGDIILNARLYVLSADTNAVVADVGLTGGDVDLFIDGAALNSTLNTPMGVPGVAFKDATTAPYDLTGGYAFTAADTIDIILTAAAPALTTTKFMLEIDKISIASMI